MSDDGSQLQEAPIILVMKRLAARANQCVTQGKIAKGEAAIAIIRFRNLLVKIYGKDSLQVETFPVLRKDLNNDEFLAELKNRVKIAEQMINTLASFPQNAKGHQIENTKGSQIGKRIFIGHGRSPLWRELKDFLSDTFGLPWDEFNRESTAGYHTSERLQEMLDNASFAFLIMTAEEEHADSSVHAKPNVIHEVGLFQGRLGIRRAIILMEEGCAEFSNIFGLTQIRFPRGDIAARFEEIRRVLQREKLV